MEKVALTKLVHFLSKNQNSLSLLRNASKICGIRPLYTSSSGRSSEPVPSSVTPASAEDIFNSIRPTEILFNSLCDDGKIVTIDSLLKAITRTGLRQNDPRLRESMQNVMQIQNTHDLKQFELDHDTFRDVIQVGNLTKPKKDCSGDLYFLQALFYLSRFLFTFEFVQPYSSLICHSRIT